VSEDMHTRHRLESYRLYEMDQRVKAREAKREAEEALRKAEETVRKAEETVRKAEETTRKAEETARKAEETARKAEETAIKAEEKGMEKGRVEGMKKTIELLEQGYSFDEIKKILLDGSGQRRGV
jgi:membrane protein involved in colicin uptake